MSGDCKHGYTFGGCRECQKQMTVTEQKRSDCCNAELHIVDGVFTCLYCGKKGNDLLSVFKDLEDKWNANKKETKDEKDHS